MPKVGSRNFTYDESGYLKAMEEAKRTGLPIEHEDKNYAQYAGGGGVLSKIEKYAKEVNKAAAKKPGAYQTHEGGVILNSMAPASVRAIGKTFNAAQRALSSKQAPSKGKQERGTRKKKGSVRGYGKARIPKGKK